MEIKILTDKNIAIKIGEFLTGPNAFDVTWAPNEKDLVCEAPIESIGKSNHRYWYIQDNDQIIAAIGVRENKLGSGGYEMDSDYVAVHKDYRKKGLAKQLIKAVEDYVKANHGRYIHVVTCDIESFKPARKFYENAGYKKVSEMPDYFVVGEGRIDYYKEL